MLCSCLTGCSSGPDIPNYPSSEALEGVQRADNECLEAWINSEATHDTITAGIDSGVLLYDPDKARYLVQAMGPAFEEWTISEPVPWSSLRTEVLVGYGCPFLPVSDEIEEKNRAAAECLSVWLRTKAPQSIITEGIDRGVITVNSQNNSYMITIDGEGFRNWLRLDDSTPSIWSIWADLRAEVVYGYGCPYR